MQADERFLKQPKRFWANVRTISEKVGYTIRGTGKVKIPDVSDIRQTYTSLGLTAEQIATEGRLTEFGDTLLAYFSYRAAALYDEVRKSLMTAEEAKELFERTYNRLNPTCPIPMNKQKGSKRAPAYLTGLVNMLIQASIEGNVCDYDPRELTTATREGTPLRTLARRVDGAFPSTVNPIAIWEIKEYYYTTTFGSRVADGVYETLLDGMELEELREHENIDIHHYLIVDAYNTWWKDGKSYLCRMIDMLHMGYVDEIIFGREVLTRIPSLAAEWVADLRAKPPTSPEDIGKGHWQTLEHPPVLPFEKYEK